MSRTHHIKGQRRKPLNPAALTGCRECGKPLSAHATVKRRMCRSCWRVHRLLVVST